MKDELWEIIYDVLEEFQLEDMTIDPNYVETCSSAILKELRDNLLVLKEFVEENE